MGGKPNPNTLEYDTDTWTDLGINPPNDLFLGRGCFYNNKFYCMGTDNADIYVYEPPGVAGNSTGTWSTITEEPPKPPESTGLGFLVAYDDALWRWGGDADNSLWKFDIATETWTDTAAPSPFSGVYSNSALVGNTVYIFNASSSNIASSVNLDTLTWGTSTSLQATPDNGYLASTIVYKDDYIMLVGGHHSYTSLYVYSIELDKHVKIDNTLDLPASSYLNNAVIIDKTLYFFRGQASHGGSVTDDFYKLDLKF